MNSRIITILTAVIALSLTEGCITDETVNPLDPQGEGGDGPAFHFTHRGHHGSTTASTTTVSSSSGGTDQCSDLEEACPQGSTCYDFKSCYEDVQDDSIAVQDCVDQDPEAAAQWAELVACLCDSGQAPDYFCTKMPYGHPAG